MFKPRFFCVFLLLSSLGWCAQAELPTAKPAIKLVYVENSYIQEIAMSILTEVYRRLNQPVEFIALPGRRTFHLSLSGEVDGEVARIKQLGPRFESLTALSTPLFTFDARLYSNDKNLHFASRDEMIADLASHQLASRLGIIWEEQLLHNLQLQPIRLRSMHQGLMMLASGRVDLMLGNNLETELLINRFHPDAGLVAVEPKIATYAIHHYLHEDKVELAHEVELVLQAMQLSGELERLVNAFAAHAKQRQHPAHVEDSAPEKARLNHRSETQPEATSLTWLAAQFNRALHFFNQTFTQ